jgi:hypothetical protein
MGAVQAFLRESHFAKPALTLPIALGVHAIYGLILMAFAISVMWSKARPSDKRMAFLWALTAALLALPRIIDTDLAVLIIPFLVFARSLIVARGPGLTVLAVGFVLAVSMSRTPLADWGGIIVVAAAWAGMGVDWLRAANPAPSLARAA